jgi:hypothetical protein
MVSPWAQLEQQSLGTQAPPPPGVFAPVEMPSAPPEMASPLPQVARTPTPIENNMQNDQQQLQKVRWQQANPWGTPDNHPGTLGKVAHVFSNIGNIAGDIFAPDVMAHIPGTQMNREAQEKTLTNRLNQENTENDQNLQREAMTAHENEETAEAPGKSADTHALTQSTIDKNSQDKAVSLQQAHANAVQKAIEAGRDPSTDPVVQNYEDAIQRIQKQPTPAKPDTPEQQYIDEYQQKHPGSGIGAAERAYTLDTQRPPQIAPIMMMVPNANGGSTATVVRPGSEVAPGAQTAAGLNSQNTPTAQMRNTAQRAELVHEMTPELLQNISANAEKLGPVMGNWNAFMQGKVGLDNPAFADLRADLLLYSSSVALAHAQGRLPENLREEFDHMINAPKQTPANLTAVINRVDKAMQLNKKVMSGKSGEPEQGSALPAGVPQGYVLRDGPKGRGYYAPTAK